MGDDIAALADRVRTIEENQQSLAAALSDLGDDASYVIGQNTAVSPGQTRPGGQAGVQDVVDVLEEIRDALEAIEKKV